MSKLKLTQLFVNNPPYCPDRRKTDYFDTLEPGLLLEVRCTNKCTFYLRQQAKPGKTKQRRLGSTKELSLAQARQEAARIKAELAEQEPAQQEEPQEQEYTLQEFVQQRYLPYVKMHKRSWEFDQRTLMEQVLPRWGEKKLSQITQQDVIQYHHSFALLDYKPATANRYLALIKHLFNLAVKWELLNKSPAGAVAPFAENNQKERYLSTQETQDLLQALKKSHNPVIPEIILFLLFTGARRAEAMGSRWQDMDLERNIWTIPLSKSGKARYVPLSDAALQVLKRRREKSEPDSEYVFANPHTGQPFKHIYGAWNRIRKKAGIPDVRIHDLRHNFASMLVNQGRSLYEVQKLLGHADSKTTQRYAHLSQESLIEAANLVGQSILVGQEAA